MNRTQALAAVQDAKRRRDTRAQHEATAKARQATLKVLMRGRRRWWQRIWRW